jgi:hypothetical protein
MTAMMKQTYYFDELVKNNILSFIPPPPPTRYDTFSKLEIGKWYKCRSLRFGLLRSHFEIVSFKLTKRTAKTISYEYRTPNEYGKDALIAKNKRVKTGLINGNVCEYIKNHKINEYVCFCVDDVEYLKYMKYCWEHEDDDC